MKQKIWHEGVLFDYAETVEVPDPDTSLHSMAGPWQPTPQWIRDSWARAAERRQAAETAAIEDASSES